jgi:PhnB protein
VEDEQGVVPMLSYRHGPEAMEWLAAAFGFRESTRWLDDDGVLAHGEMATDRGVIMLATPTPDYEGPLSHRSHCDGAAAWSAAPWVVDGVLVYVDDVASHFERAKAGGAGLLSGLEEGPGGSRLYRAEDLEGHRWMFMQRPPVS